jgi:serine/threonine protein kinase
MGDSEQFAYTTGGDTTLRYIRQLGQGGGGHVHEVIIPLFPKLRLTRSFPISPTARSEVFHIIIAKRKAFARKLVQISAEDETIEAEIKVIKRICEKGSHPHIVQVLKMGRLHGSREYFIDMELCNLNLVEYINCKHLRDEALPFYNKKVPPPLRSQQIWYVMIHVGRGVKFMHSLGLVHRDLKPANGMDPLLALD